MVSMSSARYGSAERSLGRNGETFCSSTADAGLEVKEPITARD
jgi:hypothetical protein